jgi:hypothetical protein
MPLTLNVDGKNTKRPTASDIAFAFDALDKRTGLIHGGLSLVMLIKDEVHWLTAAGHADEGFALSYQDGDPQFEYFSDNRLSTTDVIRIFQTYAAGSDWGKETFKWDRTQQFDTRTQARRLMWILAMGLVACGVAFLLKYFFAGK